MIILTILIIGFGIYIAYLQIAALYRTRRLNQIAYQLDIVIRMMKYKIDKEEFYERQKMQQQQQYPRK